MAILHQPMTGEQLTALCFIGLLVFACGIGVAAYRHLRRPQGASGAPGESERRHRLVAEHAGDLVAMVDREGRWLYTSPSYARIFSAADLAAGADAFRNLHEDDQFRVRGALQVVVRSGESSRLRIRLHTLSGDVRRFEATLHPVREERGATTGAGTRITGAGTRITGAGTRITGAVMASRDVTELRDREEQLEVAVHAFEHMSEALVIASAAGRILTVNRSFSRITGYSPPEVLGRPESEFRSAMQPDAFYDDMYATVLRTGNWQGTTWCRRRDGSMYREWRSVSAVRDADGRLTHFVALFRELDGQGAGREVQDPSANSA